ncbi:hypothetical protein Tco_1417430 [Tanacetum coccineum]
MANLNQLAIDSKSEQLSEQVLLYVEREMARELRMTRLLTDLCHEVTDSVKHKEDLIVEVKELGVATQGSDSMAFLRILRDEDLDKAKDIMNLLKETQKHTRQNTKKHQSVVMSSAEAEYVVTARCCASILWMKSQLSDYDIHYKMVPIFCDNTSAIAISNNPVLHSRTKHIDIRYHFIRDHILKGDIELHFIPAEYQLNDIFTKPLDEPTFIRLKAELGMLNID